MKRIQRVRFKSRLAMGLVLVLLLSPGVFAESRVHVKGYLGEDFSENDIKEAKAQFTVSNVMEIINLNIPGHQSQLRVQSPSRITLEDEPFLFEVYKGSFDEEGNFDYSDEDSLPISGKVKIHLYDEELAETTSKVIDASEVEDYGNEIWTTPQVGSGVELTEEGYYYVVFRYEAIAGSTEAIIEVSNSKEEVVVENKDIIAKSSDSKVLVDGKEIVFEAYNIEGNNYFKLRDLAKSLSSSKKQFDVKWNEEKKEIELLSNQEYTPVGGELEKGDNLNKTGRPNMSKIYKDGEEIDLLAYNINGNNYFKLRDIGEIFNIEIGWDGEKRIVLIETETQVPGTFTPGTFVD